MRSYAERHDRCKKSEHNGQVRRGPGEAALSQARGDESECCCDDECGKNAVERRAAQIMGGPHCSIGQPLVRDPARARSGPGVNVTAAEENAIGDMSAVCYVPTVIGIDCRTRGDEEDRAEYDD